MNVRKQARGPSTQGPTADEVLELVRAGKQRDALRLLMDAWGDLVYRVCCRVAGDPSEAYDLRQETFLTVFRALDKYKGDGTPRSFVLGVMSKQLAEHGRKRQRDRRRRDKLAAAALSAGDIARTPEQAELHKRDALNRCLSKLPAETRTVVILRHQEGLSGEEIARVVGQDVNAVYQRSSRGVGALRQCLEKAGVRT